MKVLLVNTFYHPYTVGGAEVSTELLARALSARGIETVVLTINPTSYRTVIDDNGPIRTYRINPGNPYLVNARRKPPLLRPLKLLLSFWNVFTYMIARDVLEREHPDVVHTNNLYDISPSIWSAAKSYGIPVVHTVRDYDLLCLQDDLLPYRACRIYKWARNLWLKNVDALTFISRFSLGKHRDLQIMKERPHFVIYNAIDVEAGDIDAAVKCRLSKKEEALRFVYCGRIEAMKGIYLLLDAFRELVDLGNTSMELHILGDAGSVSDRYSGYRQIRFHGFLTGHDKESIMLESDVAVVPSLWEEPFGRAVIEAYRYALPVIGSSSGALPELVEDGHTGIIFGNGDKESLKEAMKTLSSDRALLKKLAVNAAEKAKEFLVRHQVDSFVSLYEKISGRPA